MRESLWWQEAAAPPSVRQSLRVRKLHEEQSRFQRIEVFDHDVLGTVLVLDGFVQTTTRDEFYYHEMLAHVPLTARRWSGPTRVLIIGGGDGGLLRTVLEHDTVDQVRLVEIDERVIEIGRDYFGNGPAFDDRRVSIQVGDASEFVASGRNRSQFAVVLSDAPDPVGPAEVLYTKDFVAGVRACQSAGGVFARHLGVPFYQRDILAGGARRLRQVYGACEIYRVAVPAYTGGDMAFAIVAADGETCAEPVTAHDGRYYNSKVHRAAFALPSWWRDLCSGS